MKNRHTAESTASINAQCYSAETTRRYAPPHLRHDSLKRLYADISADVYGRALGHGRVPDVLDLGAGEGSVTRTFLELGARVTAVDISHSQLSALRSACALHADRLTVRCQEAEEAIRQAAAENRKYDIVTAVSFLHHVPDYLSLIGDAVSVLSFGGQFLSFQDPLRYDSLRHVDRFVSGLAYLTWRLFRGDLRQGTKRALRRRRGIYVEGSPEDNVEYHVVRKGVDQEAIRQMARDMGCGCTVIAYFSTQNPFWQKVGTALDLRNHFAVMIQK